MRRAKNQVEGFVTEVTVRQVRRKEFWSHSYRIGPTVYSLLSNTDIAEFKIGDLLRFEWIGRRGRYHTYRNIVGKPQLVRATEDLERISGYVYVMSNRSMKGLFKIGMTTRTPEERAAELSSVSGVPHPFEVRWARAVVGDVARIERLVHDRLAKHREGKEFFRIGLAQATSTIDEVCIHLYPEQHDTPNTIEARQRAFDLKVAERDASLSEAALQRNRDAIYGKEDSQPSEQGYYERAFQEARQRHANRAPDRPPSTSASPEHQAESDGGAALTLFFFLLGLILVIGFVLMNKR